MSDSTKMTDPIVKELEIEEEQAPMILVIGQTGAGKSHFINRVAGETVVKESAHLSSCTSKVGLAEVSVDNNDFLLIDTPGFNDTWRYSQRSDAKILGEIARTLTLQTQLGVKLRGILYLYDIMAPRMTGDTLRQLEMINRICGDKNYENVMLVTTHWPRDVQEQKDRNCAIREGDLRRDFWKEMVKGGSKMWRFDDEPGTARAIVRSLAGKRDITLALQDEMAGGKPLSGTTAGSYIVNARLDDQKKLAARMMDEADSASADLQESRRMQDSVENRKAAEEDLKQDLVKRIRTEIETMDKEARKKNMKPTVKNFIDWLIGISSLTAQVVQTVLGGT